MAGTGRMALGTDSVGRPRRGRLGPPGADSVSGEPDSATPMHPEYHKLGLLRSLLFLADNPFPSPFTIGLDHGARLAVLAQSPQNRSNRGNGVAVILQRESLEAEAVADLMRSQRRSGLQQRHPACVRQTGEMSAGALGKNASREIDHLCGTVKDRRQSHQGLLHSSD